MLFQLVSISPFQVPLVSEERLSGTVPSPPPFLDLWVSIRLHFFCLDCATNVRLIRSGDPIIFLN
jgi:hypothetical protein